MDPIISQLVIAGLNGLLVILALLCFDAVVRICVLSYKKNRDKQHAVAEDNTPGKDGAVAG